MLTRFQDRVKKNVFTLVFGTDLFNWIIKEEGTTMIYLNTYVLFCYCIFRNLQRICNLALFNYFPLTVQRVRKTHLHDSTKIKRVIRSDWRPISIRISHKGKQRP